MAGFLDYDDNLTRILLPFLSLRLRSKILKGRMRVQDERRRTEEEPKNKANDSTYYIHVC